MAAPALECGPAPSYGAIGGARGAFDGFVSRGAPAARAGRGELDPSRAPHSGRRLLVPGGLRRSRARLSVVADPRLVRTAHVCEESACPVVLSSPRAPWCPR